ncbi:efflux RND transporter permease subunit [Flocculibacter collagenilyticus]|uniref:efflux RND transporter permease subunit n=1 Tax=Flocculibacter collagenilyticus TaxID=2744479 RepID=UPI0018F7C311|nr:efflux RND transporter permease subunit [Flocculibacter collagenilyticus]
MIKFFARHPTIANLLMLALIVLGISSVSDLKRETFPEFQLSVITVSIVYPGASPIEVEESVCLRMEDAVDGLANIEEVKCDAQESLAKLTLKLDDKADLGRMLVDVQTQINAIDDFPQEIESPIVQEINWADPVVDIAIYADTDMAHLKDYAEDVKRRLKIDAGISLVRIAGFSDHQLRIELNQADMRRLGLTAAEVADKVGRQNIRMPAGTIDLPDKSILVRVDERRVTAQQLSSLVVASNSNGGNVTLGDIATITNRFELDEEYIEFNGKPAAILKVEKNKADDVLRIKQRVDEFIEAEKKIAPDGVSISLTNDMSTLVGDRIAMMVSNAWQGIILVFLSMWLFFSLRYSFWVSAGLPVAFMGGLYLMSLFGLSINMMSLVALLMAIGIMMDDAIVIAESIASHRERGYNVDKAVIEGVKKVAPGVFSSFFTTVCIFGSLLGLEGQIGSVLAVVPMVLILVLIISLIEAFLILPNHLHHSLTKHQKEKAATGFKAAFLKKFEDVKNTQLVNTVTLLVKWRYATIGGTFALFLLAISMIAGGVLKMVPFPELDGDIAEARIIMPPGTALADTQAIVELVVKQAKQVGEALTAENDEPEPLIKDITAQFNFNADAGEKGAHVATVRLDLFSAEQRNTSIEHFIQQWRHSVEEKADPISMVFKQPALGPAGRDLEIQLQHRDLDTLKSASVELQRYLTQFNGVTGVIDDMRPGKQEIKISLADSAQSYGIDGSMIAQQLRSALLGQTADQIQVGAESIEIEVRLNKNEADNLTKLINFPIMLPSGQQIPLSAIANLDYQRSFVRVQRVDGIRTVTVIGDVDNNVTNSGEILAKFSSELQSKLQKDYPSLRIVLAGSAEESSKTGSSFVAGFLIGLFGLFAILSFQFRSYIEPFVVMLAIPMALIGVIFGHLLLGFNLSMPSIMGFISLAGIVVNDSILLVQYIRHHVDEGDEVQEAVISASRERFRAVFLTSLTTAAGLLPLLLETSLQAQVVQPLVISIVFGIFTSTLLVLFVIPCAYAVLADYNLVHNHKALTYDA